ncbi:unnamed protein product (macronuclear) [Paramecium tetraurelia]|uniref:Ribosomal RNA large subunit methyltransferase K/L-like methyltransferase domain-containing protein n=1 Tax=Paramecium tetraurelia TaxID=5888 RepID=A0CF83_PARTE|nr:uncharacterized protein GSPATT00037889001 [Paramecium tetraurelia]CAK69450.1 unnamed protein product [Paramecium tetraurelia]|eukprot:XP_001436847.1 hypothetical protein (macronuclear) [Paramecium tetraurelia strain d4-2]
MIQEQEHTVTLVINQSIEMGEFGIQEAIQLFELFGLPYQELFKQYFPIHQFPKKYEITSQTLGNYPFVDVQLRDLDLIHKVLNRSILLHDILYTLSRGNTLEELAQNLLPQALQYVQNPNLSCKCDIITSYFKISQERRVELIEQVFGEKGFKSQNTINLTDPDILYYVIITKDQKYIAGCTLTKKKKRREKNFARNYELPNRIYLGPVSLAHDLAFLMANQAIVQENDFVFDPFAGTGSSLVACSHFGAICFGSEIDGNLMKGHCIGYLNKKSTYLKDPNFKQVKPFIHLNFNQYNLPIPNLIQADVHLPNFNPRIDSFFDAIICDPPYGIRASIQQEGNEQDLQANRTAIYRRMFEVARRVLRKGGRLVYLYPLFKGMEKKVEKEEGFELIDFREQKMVEKRSRLLVTMQKL